MSNVKQWSGRSSSRGQDEASWRPGGGSSTWPRQHFVKPAYKAKDDPKANLNPPPPPMGELLDVIDPDDLHSLASTYENTALITDCRAVASYSWDRTGVYECRNTDSGYVSPSELHGLQTCRPIV